MKIADPSKILHPLFHLSGRFVRESHRQNIARVDFFFFDEIGNPMHQQAAFFPLPAPAITKIGPSVARTASFCSSFKPLIISIT